MLYKRNQVEEAVACILQAGSKNPSAELSTQIKRLLETDRRLPWEPDEGLKSVPLAFFTHASPGRGQDNLFSGYEAFALTMGVMIIRHGWTQGFAVKVLRRLRPELETAFGNIVKHHPPRLFNHQYIVSNSNIGLHPHYNQEPFFLAIVSSSYLSESNLNLPFACSVERGEEAAMKFVLANRMGGGGFTMFDIVGTAHNLSATLSDTKPQSRGRG